MASLVVNPRSAEPWEAALKPGLNTVGRSTDNDVPIEHPSVSSFHIQLEVDGNSALLKDVGSTNGTFLRGELVEEVRLYAGQFFRIGEVELQLVGLPARAEVPLAEQAQERPAPEDTAPYTEPAEPRYIDSDRPFVAMAGSAFAYPLVGDGLYVFIAGIICYALLMFLMLVSGRVALIIGAFASAYVIAFLQSVITSSARGEAVVPDWPDLTEFNKDIASPLAQLLGVLLFSFGPVLAIHFFAPENANWVPTARVAAWIFACAYAPMAYLAVTMFDSLGALNPLLIVRSIAVIPTQYLLAALLVGALTFALCSGRTVIADMTGMPFLSDILARIVALYLSIVAARVLGLLYFATKTKLRWFSRY